jgi:WD40 repeat protein
MKKILIPIILILLGCERKFEPELRGWQAYTLPGHAPIQLVIEGQEKTVELPGDNKVRYRYAQWTKFQHQILLVQLLKTERCDDYQLIAIDTTGAIVDTIYTPPPNTPINFKLAPNDSLLLLKTYHDDCEYETENFKYTFYNRHSKTALPDTIAVGNARAIPLRETVWSPDSRKVIIPKWSGRRVEAFTYNLATKDTTYIDIGTNFIWSPTDNNLVAYIKDHSIYTMNVETGKKEIIYGGHKKKSATDFRFNPSGDYLMIHVGGYLLNVEAPPLHTDRIIYFSLKDKTESRFFYDGQRIDTWKEVASTDSLR